MLICILNVKWILIINYLLAKQRLHPANEITPELSIALLASSSLQIFPKTTLLLANGQYFSISTQDSIQYLRRPHQGRSDQQSPLDP